MQHDPQDVSAFAEEHQTVNLTNTTLKRFWRKVDKGESEDCWNWNRSTFKTGYGACYLPELKRVITAHRISFLIAHGYLPTSLLDVCHKCDNRKCVNPSHLFLGTRKDNMQDARSKGRCPTGDQSPARKHPEKQSHGSDHYLSKLDEEKVIQIWFLHRAGFHKKEIASRFGIHYMGVHKILIGETWKHVKPPEESEFNPHDPDHY